MHTSLYNQYAQQAEGQSHAPRVLSWEQAALGGGLLVLGYLFVHLGNGFPPRVWGEFAQFVMGQRIGQSFTPVLLQSFLYLVGWLLLLLIALHVLRPAFLSPLYRGDTRKEMHGQAQGLSGSLHQPLRRAVTAVGIGTKPAHQTIPHKKPASEKVTGTPSVSNQRALGNEVSASPGLLMQFIASSREYTAPTAFCLSGEIAPGASSSGTTRAALTGAFMCRPGCHAGGKGIEDDVMITSGLCHPPTYASSSSLVPFTLFIVASGQSDERLQQAVSRICIQAINYALCRALAKNASFSQEGLEILLGKSIQRTNAMLYQHNQKHKAASAVTVTGILILSGVAFIAYAGNHRAYLYRPHKGFKHLTRDRTTETEHLASDQQPGGTDRKSASNCMLGKQELASVQTHQVRLQADDLLILCSSGFWKRVSQAAFLQLMKDEIGTQQPAATQLCSALLETVQARDGDEPMSALVARASLL